MVLIEGLKSPYGQGEQSAGNPHRIDMATESQRKSIRVTPKRTGRVIGRIVAGSAYPAA
jgi:hypothetical protein